MKDFSCTRLRENVADKVTADLPDPLLAGIFAIVGISLGQFYNGRILQGIFWGAGGLVLFFLIRNNILIAPAGVFFLVACAFDAYFTAEEIRGRKIPFRNISSFFWIEAVVMISLLTAFCCITIIRMQT